MATIALVSGRLTGADANVQTSALLTLKGHTPTFFDQSAVTAGNLSAFALIYINLPDVADATFEGHIRGYMRTDNIPVIVVGYDGSGVVTDSLVTALGIAQSVEGVADPTAGIDDAVLPTGYEDLQVVAGMDALYPIQLRTETGEGWTIPKASKSKGTILMRDAAGDVIMFQAESTDTDFTDTSQVLGSRFVWLGWSGDEGHAREGASLIKVAIDWAIGTVTFDYPTSGNQFALARPIDLSRMVNYADSEVNWTPTTPASTSVLIDESQDELATFDTVAAAGNEFSGFVPSDPVTGDIFLRFNLNSTVIGSTPEIEQADLVRDGQSPSLRQLGAVTAVDHDPLVQAEDEWYTGGMVTFLTGNNAGLSMEVRKWTNATNLLELFEPMKFAIEVDDIFTVYPGCDKTIAACRDKFDNVVNFRGEPFVPGNDQLFRSPDIPPD